MSEIVQKYLETTNADRIRSMTDEELACFLGNIIQTSMLDYAAIDYGDEFAFVYSWKDWLKQEAADKDGGP